MSVIGLDIGNENCVISAAQQKGIDVLLNEECNRETPAMVSFGEKQRFLGSAGAAAATFNPKSSISQLKRLIGRAYDQPDVKKDLELLPFDTCADPDGMILIRLEYMGRIHSFTPVQILAMLLSHLKQTAEKNLETSVSDCVIGIPSYFTDLQKRLYLDAASIAGLNPLRLMHDCTATALGYGIYKTDFAHAREINVVFVDIGHCDTQVSVVSFQPEGLHVLSHAFDSNFGGRDFDEVLFRHFADQFEKQYKIKVCSNLRASIRLRASCEKLKKVLSANAVAPLNIECLMDEKDVKGFIQRDEFEMLSSSLLERVTVPCHDALAAAGLSLEDIHSVELVGSGSRIPAVTRALSDFFKREPSRTINASECVARGCAVQCAMLSPIFRVRQYEVQDALPFSIGIASNDRRTNSVLFHRGHSIPSVKILNFYQNMFPLKVFYSNQYELPPAISQEISMFTVGPLTLFQVSSNHDSMVKVQIHLNLHGIVTIESASVTEAQSDDSIKISKDEIDEDIVNVSPDPRNGAEDRYSSPYEPASGKGANSRVVKRHAIPVGESVDGGMLKVDLSEAKQREIELTKQDNKVEHAKERKNSLESYVYEARNKILNMYQSFATEKEREEISQMLQETEDWLYGEGDDETAADYHQKLEQLKMLIDPIEHRYKEEEIRAEAICDLNKCIALCRTAANSLSSTDKDVVLNECNKVDHWLQDGIQQQNLLPKISISALCSADIRRAEEAIKGLFNKVINSTPNSTHERDEESNMEVD